jgi:hypothetical protein
MNRKQIPIFGYILLNIRRFNVVEKPKLDILYNCHVLI